jgi:hypothetical protein
MKEHDSNWCAQRSPRREDTPNGDGPYTSANARCNGGGEGARRSATIGDRNRDPTRPVRGLHSTGKEEHSNATP